MKYPPIPDEALDDRLFFGGTAGSGKTYNAMGRVERLLARGDRAVIPDPLGVWWGLRLAADGKAPSGFDVVIFGGPHGDLPLTEHAGALIGETVAGMKESCILDLSQLGTKAAERRFMLAFLTALYRNTAGEPLHVIFDEADMWAPQKLLDKEGEAAKLLGMMETLVRRGRVKGFIPWLISQRPAVISKDILSQADGMVAFKLTGAHDRGAIGAWVEGQAGRNEWKAIDGRLPTMERGQGVVWLPGRGILETVQFPPKATFDSSRTPKRGEKVTHADLKPLDLGALKDRLGKVEAEVQANDPKALKARIRELEAEVARKPAPAVDGVALLAARQEGFSDGLRAINVVKTGISQMLATAEASLRDIRGAIDSPLPDFPRAEVPPTASGGSPTPPAPLPEIGHAISLPGSRRGMVTGSVSMMPLVNGAGPSESGDLSRGERAVLTALAQFHPKPIPPKRAAAISGYSVRASTWRGILAKLRRRDAITGSDHLGITPAGIVALGPFTPLPTGRALLEHWIGELPKGQAETLKVLAAVGGQAAAGDVATRAGYSTSASTWRGILAGLRNLDLVEGSRILKLHEDLR